MTTAPVAVDLTRLVTRLQHASPSGIDRVDLAYARHFLAQDGERFGLVSTALGPRLLDRVQANRLVDLVVAGWVEEMRAEDDPVLARLAARLAERTEGSTPDGPSRGPAPPDARAWERRRTRMGVAARIARGAVARTLPPGTLYLHTSHLRLDQPRRFDWLTDRRDIRAVFFVHDLIPIEYPEYGRPGEDERHRVRMETVRRHAAGVIVNSADVGRRFAAHAHRFGRPVVVAPLGVETSFGSQAAPRLAPSRPCFVACSTIEPRKNYLTLLNVWRELAVRSGPATPRLVIVGRRGWEAENVIDMLERCPAVREHVIEVSGLSTPGLVSLMRGATALLMPSFAEGYGLPVVEAAAVGLPVVASDIPVHREIGEAFARFVHPLDGPGWIAAVEELARPGSAERAELAARSAAYRPPGWAEHFAVVEEALPGILDR